MKIKNLWKYIWISSLFLSLIIIFILVVNYKVKWENKDLHTYLYFYNCSNQVCTSLTPVEEYYNKIKCDSKKCPHIINVNKNNLILKENENMWIYDFYDGKIINNDYDTYSYINNNLYKVSKDGLYGIIDIKGNIVEKIKYSNIVDYNDKVIVYRKDDGKYSYIITNKENNNNPAYDNFILINNNIYGYMDNNLYYIASYKDNISINQTSYDYLFSARDIIFAIKDKYISIYDNEMKDTLIMKINTFYSYKEEKERDSLNIYLDDNYLYFTVYINENDKVLYKYDIKQKKLFQ